MKMCPESCNDETGGKLIERVNEHGGEDINKSLNIRLKLTIQP